MDLKNQSSETFDEIVLRLCSEAQSLIEEMRSTDRPQITYQKLINFATGDIDLLVLALTIREVNRVVGKKGPIIGAELDTEMNSVLDLSERFKDLYRTFKLESIQFEVKLRDMKPPIFAPYLARPERLN